jgi:L-aminopeptidase/D-esterase-like protein|tara:strand:+ start:377 stop:565 length:189 start_codon:yes stop_codon:yes gene_type:complete
MQQQRPRKILPGAIVGSLVAPVPARPQAAAPPPASVIRAAVTDAATSKSQAKRNRKKMRDGL